MALTVKSNGEAVVEEPKTTAQRQTTAQATDSGNSETTTQSTKTSAANAAGQTGNIPENAAAGLDFKTVQQNLNTGYESKWDDQLADLYNQITQRKPFEYSTEDDMLYQMYKEKYTQQGKQAMRDTMGQAAALTGGYGSSYGQAVGQQQYDAYLQELNSLLPQLQDAAYQRYAAEGDRLNQLFSLTGAMDDRDLQQYQLDQTVNQNAYDRYMNEAALLGAAGDFSGYENIFGEDSAGKMATQYNLEKLLAYYDAGLVNEDEINQLLGPYLQGMGIVTPEATGGGSSDPWGYGGAGWNPGYMAGTSGTETATMPTTRGGVARAAEAAYSSGDITREEYNDVIGQLH